MTSNPSAERRTPSVPVSDDLEYEEVLVWPDEVRVGDIFGGFVITGVHVADHYRQDARRWTIFTDPEMLPEGVQSEEFGRMVVMTDRSKGHKVPVLRPVHVR